MKAEQTHPNTEQTNTNAERAWGNADRIRTNAGPGGNAGPERRNAGRTSLLILGGYDPSAGAGVLADVKTAEANGVYAHAVCTAYTFQNSRRLDRIRWFSSEDICEQIALCREDAHFNWVKVGIVRDAGILRVLLAAIRRYFPDARVIWDPVLRASSGTEFMAGLTPALFEALLPEVFMVTPNLEELSALYPGADPAAVCRRLSEKTFVYLKGGHDRDHPGRDRLFSRGSCHCFPPGASGVAPKHGSGCVLSTALAANLAGAAAAAPETALNEEVVLTAAAAGKRYTEAFLKSNPGLLGWHRPPEERPVSPTALLAGRLQFITPDEPGLSHLQQVSLACGAGIRWVQLRMKEAPRSAILETALEARRICDRYGARLIINDHPDIALLSHADGVHLGQGDMPVKQARALARHLLIGGTANTPEQALEMARQGADYIGAGPFRFTTTKKNLSPVLGRKGLEIILRKLEQEGSRVPVVAVGGIIPDDLRQLLTLPLHGLALSGAFVRAAEPGRIVEEITDCLTKREKLC